MYRAFVNTAVAVDNNHKIWKMKVSLKIKFFVWYLRRGVNLTKDNLAKQNWNGSPKCVFVTTMRQSNIYSSNATLPIFYMVIHPNGFQLVPIE